MLEKMYPRSTDRMHKPAWLFPPFNSSSVLSNPDTNREADLSYNVMYKYYPVMGII